jgi:cysteine-rich repeat protein
MKAMFVGMVRVLGVFAVAAPLTLGCATQSRTSTDKTVSAENQASAVAPFSSALPITPNCGDGVLDDDEVCDDGNNWSLDGCSWDCLHSCSGDADVWCDCLAWEHCDTRFECDRECRL